MRYIDYVLVNKENEKCFMMLDTYGKPTKTYNLKKASMFSSKQAENILSNNLPPAERDHWVIKPKREIKKYVSENNNETTLSTDWVLFLNGLEELENQIADYKSYLIERESQLDLELSDIYHLIKDCSPPAHRRVSIYNELQEVLRERDKIKEELRYCLVCQNLVDKTISKDLLCEKMKEVKNKPYKGRTTKYNELIQKYKLKGVEDAIQL